MVALPGADDAEIQLVVFQLLGQIGADAVHNAKLDSGMQRMEPGGDLRKEKHMLSMKMDRQYCGRTEKGQGVILPCFSKE